MTKNELYGRFRNLLDSTFARNSKGNGLSGAGPVYPTAYDAKVNKATECRNQGNYLESIDIFLSILEESQVFYPEIMRYMYKSVLLTGDINFAYEVIAYSEFIITRGFQVLHDSATGCEWAQTISRTELDLVLNKYNSNGFLPIFVSAKKHNQKVTEESLVPLIERYGGIKFENHNEIESSIKKALATKNRINKGQYFYNV